MNALIKMLIYSIISLAPLVTTDPPKELKLGFLISWDGFIKGYRFAGTYFT